METEAAAMICAGEYGCPWLYVCQHDPHEDFEEHMALSYQGFELGDDGYFEQFDEGETFWCYDKPQDVLLENAHGTPTGYGEPEAERALIPYELGMRLIDHGGDRETLLEAIAYLPERVRCANPFICELEKPDGIDGVEGEAVSACQARDNGPFGLLDTDAKESRHEDRSR